MSIHIKLRLTISIGFGLAALAITVLYGLYANIDLDSTPRIMFFYVVPVIAAMMWGLILAPLVLRPSIPANIFAGILVPVLAQLTFAVVLWGANLFFRWNGDHFTAYIAAYFGFALMLVGWITVPVGLLVSLGLRKLYAVTAT